MELVMARFPPHDAYRQARKYLERAPAHRNEMMYVRRAAIAIVIYLAAAGRLGIRG
jgi:hypothetical protein